MAVSIAPIDASAIGYIEGELRRGRGLARLLSGIDLHAGTVSAFLPVDQPSLAQDFADGAFRDREQAAEATDALARYLVARCGVTGDPATALICQFADGAVRRGTPPQAGPTRAHKTVWLQGADRPEDNGELWYVDHDSPSSAVAALLNDVLWFPAVGVVTRSPGPTSLVQEGELAYEALWALVEDPPLIVVGAWDAMAYLVWHAETGG